MRLPSRPPKLGDDRLSLMLDNLFKPEVQAYIAAANREYHHWDQLRYRPTPLDLSPEVCWHMVRVARVGAQRTLPLLDERGRPFRYSLFDATQATLHEVDRWGGSVLAVGPEAAPALGAMRDRIVVSTLMEEAIATSQIEGAVTTRQVAKEMLRTARKPRDRSEQMIVNSYQTIQLLRQRIDEPLTARFLLEIQASLTRDTLDDAGAAGRFRTASEPVNVVDVRDGEVMHTPPPAGQLDDRVARLLDFANGLDTPEAFIHPLVKAAILHFWLAYEHPFLDGNGRTARALFYWHMLKRGYWLFEYLTISRVILDAPADYYSSFLYSEHDGNDLTYSVLYLLKATHRAIAKLRDYLALKQQEQQTMGGVIRQLAGVNHRQREVLQEALRNPSLSFTFKSHRNTHKVTLVTARRDLIELEEKGLLEGTIQGKERAFHAAADLVKHLTGGAPSARKKPKGSRRQKSDRDGSR